MATEKTTTATNAAELTALRTEIGQSEKKVNNAAQEFVSMPEKGEFVAIATKEFTVEGATVISLGLSTKDGGFISENALRASDTLKELFAIKNGANKGLLMLRQSRLTDLNKFGASQDLQLLNLVGKKFTTEPKDTRVLTSFDKADLFCKAESDLEKMWLNTEPKKQYIFTIK